MKLVQEKQVCQRERESNNSEVKWYVLPSTDQISSLPLEGWLVSNLRAGMRFKHQNQ